MVLVEKPLGGNEPIHRGIQTEFDFTPKIPFHCQTDNTWDLSDKPILTVPDQEDSIEKMVARQRAGIEATTSQGKRNYPIDPNSLKQAKNVVEEHIKSLKEDVNGKIDNHRKNQAVLKAKRERDEKDKADFEAFKRSSANSAASK